MWYIIKRKSDNKYLSQISPILWRENNWTENINEAEKLVIGRCQRFIDSFFKEDEFEIIPV